MTGRGFLVTAKEITVGAASDYSIGPINLVKGTNLNAPPGEHRVIYCPIGIVAAYGSFIAYFSAALGANMSISTRMWNGSTWGNWHIQTATSGSTYFSTSFKIPGPEFRLNLYNADTVKPVTINKLVFYGPCFY